MSFADFDKEWGINGMSADKIRLATAAYKRGMLDAAEIAKNAPIKEQCMFDDDQHSGGFRDGARCAARDIKAKVEETGK